MEYGSFEGVILEGAGAYVAGEVIIWNERRYDPLRDKEEGLRKGNIKFILRELRLSGEFALVRLKKEMKSNEWLLIRRGINRSTTLDKSDSSI